MSKNAVNNYDVSEEEVIKAAQIIFSKLTYGKTPQKNPLGIIIGGQPGAGKSGVMAYYQNKHPEAILYDIDSFRFYHPKFDEISHQHPNDFVSLTGSFLYAVSHMLIPQLIQEKYSVIFHKTMADNMVVFDTMLPLKESGYTIHACAVAVNEMESKMSALERAAEEYSTLGWCRWVAKANHDRAYSGLPSVMKFIEEGKYADIVSVFKRGDKIDEPKLIYSSCVGEFSNGEDFNPFGYKNAFEAINQARAEDSRVIAAQIPERLANIKIDNDQVAPFVEELKELSSAVLSQSPQEPDTNH